MQKDISWFWNMVTNVFGKLFQHKLEFIQKTLSQNQDPNHQSIAGLKVQSEF